MRPWMQAAMTYFYPRSPCGERHGAELDIHHNFPISIHALLAESDSAGQAEKPGNRDFYPRSPCGERRRAQRMRPYWQHFYPRSPCGERHKKPLIN